VSEVLCAYSVALHKYEVLAAIFHCGTAAKGRETPSMLAPYVGDIASRHCALTAFEAIARTEGP
jgi:hypothetical protein